MILLIKRGYFLFPINIYKKFQNRNCIKTLFLIDILYMKDINAIYGFKNGDIIISQFKKLIQSLIKKEIQKLFLKSLNKKVAYELKNRHVDVFALTLYENVDKNLLLEIKDIIINKLITYQFKLFNPDLYINIDITIGCSKSADERLIVYAEKALHNAKLGYETYMFFDSNLYKNEYINKNLVDIIKYNIENEKVEPYYQAIACNNTDNIVKYEALMRLFDKEGNVLLPGSFLEKAKKYRLYNKLMQILINKVFDTILKYKIHTSINLEYKDIVNPLIKEIITNRLQNDDIGQYLTIEILESEKIINFDVVNDFIQKLKEYNVNIAIDDFGTGFSNYEYILKLNIDYIKIDGSLIQKIDEEIYTNLIKSIVMFCKKQKIKLIAEYVSDIKILRYVKSLGIDYSQGYYIQKPIPIEQIAGEINEA